MNLSYWHNPRCTKSREALALLRAKGVEPSVREYLVDVPSESELKRVLALLGFPTARDMMRTKEEAYRVQGLKDETDEDRLIAAMAREPRLIERPILISETKAAVGRPVETILDAL